jgi:RimJ/RimL family protein N-acetyltransferase
VRLNHLGQPIGDSVGEWKPPPVPPRELMTGRYCRLEPLAVRHARELWDAYAHDRDHRNWTYLPNGPYETFDGYAAWVESAGASSDPLFFAVVTTTARPAHAAASRGAVGVAAYLRIAPEAGSIEVGHINFSPLLQRTPAATEAMFLMMRRAFELGYRRYEWKCDALNAPSRRAAERLGLKYEGIFQQATVYKGRNRDTAWYAVIDKEWPDLQAAFERWLDPENFDADGLQRSRLGA